MAVSGILRPALSHTRQGSGKSWNSKGMATSRTLVGKRMLIDWLLASGGKTVGMLIVRTSCPAGCRVQRPHAVWVLSLYKMLMGSVLSTGRLWRNGRTTREVVVL